MPSTLVTAVPPAPGGARVWKTLGAWFLATARGGVLPSPQSENTINVESLSLPGGHPNVHMSEEKPNFKVTDRRLFNADGTARDDVREARDAERQAADDAAATTAAEGAAAAASSAPVASDAAPAPGPAPEPARTPTGVAPAPGAEPSRGPAAPAGQEEDDPQEFMMVVEFVASFAAESLGMSAHPEAAGQPPHINLPLARQCIDMLATLERKTRGNLGDEEKEFLDVVIAQLRMHYVELSKQRPAAGGPPRGFSGSDITGGR
jgi:Domain of unknown function (DUF1844)